MQKIKYLLVDESELEFANTFRQPVRAHKNLNMYDYLTKPLVFMEVTDSVKFKRDSVGNAKFVSNRVSVIRPKHSKSRKNSGSSNGSRRVTRKAV